MVWCSAFAKRKATTLANRHRCHLDDVLKICSVVLGEPFGKLAGGTPINLSEVAHPRPCPHVPAKKISIRRRAD